jgi:hypothetical protein
MIPMEGPMFRSVVLLFGYCLCASAATGSKPDLSGDWQLQDDSNHKIKLVIAEDPAQETVRIVETSADSDRKTEFDCSVKGKECQGTFEGEPAKITVYYNGPTLVELASRGRADKVTKTRRTLSPDGNSLTVEVVDIVPPGKKDKLTYTRVPR